MKPWMVAFFLFGCMLLLSGLVYMGKANPEILSAPVAAFLGWLSKSPGEATPPPGASTAEKAAIGFVAGAALCWSLYACGGFIPTADEVKDLGQTRSQIDYCKAVGYDAGSYSKYDGCMREAGLH